MGFSEFLKNVGKVVETANNVFTTVNGINSIDQWLNEKIHELNNTQTHNEALVEIAYYIGTMDANGWNYFQNHLNIKVLRNSGAGYLSKVCLHYVSLESGQFKNLLSYSIGDAIDTLKYNISNMSIVDLAGYYGLLKAYAGRDPKANAIFNNMRQLLLNS